MGRNGLNPGLLGIIAAGVIATGSRIEKPYAVCTFCDGSIMSEVERLPNPTSCVSLGCLEK